MKKFFSFSVRFLLVGALLWYMIQKGFMSLGNIQSALKDYHNIVPGAGLLFICTFLGIYRWHLLLQDQGIRLSFRETTELAFIGNFFNITLPGAVTSDVIKAYYLSKVSQEGHKSVTTIVFDRFVGLSALVLVSFLGLLFNIKNKTNLYQPIALWLWLSASIFGAIYLILFALPDRFDGILKAFSFLEKKRPKLSSMSKFYLALKSYKHKKMLLFQTLFISVVIQVLLVLSYIFFAYALKENQISIPGLFVVTPLVLLACAIPIAPGGLGTGNVAFLAFAQQINSHRGADLFSISALISIFLSFIGAMIYLKWHLNPEKSFSAKQ
jgi:uncharacterized protein (TIRG00374 family)